jgi:hypothetical protein
MRDWTYATSVIDATALRARREAVERLAGLEPPTGELGAAQVAAVAAWRARLEHGAADAAGRIEQSLTARTCHDALLGRVPAGAEERGLGRYAAALGKLKSLDVRGAGEVSRAIKQEGTRLVRTLENTRPPAHEAAHHAALVDLVRSYVNVQEQVFSAVARKDGPAARAAAHEYVRLNEELTGAAQALYERATG